MLFLATVIALVWSNLPIYESYRGFWHLHAGLHIGTLEFDQSLHGWINDGLMVVFFFVIGLEIKQEMLVGELSSPGQALLPILAAIGGMVVPVGLYWLLPSGESAPGGWGIPMATDIAFSLGILHLLGKRVPMALKIFLTAFAIVDDLGAVAVIAIFYSEGIEWMWLGISGGALAILVGMSFLHLYNKYVLLVLGIVVWLGFLQGGLHPTLAGVLVAMTVPVYRKINLTGYLDYLKESIEDLVKPDPKEPAGTFLSPRQLSLLTDIETQTDSVQSPVQYLENKLHGYVAWIVLPLFALANAGVHLNPGADTPWALVLGIAISMVVGKFLGITGFSWVAWKSGWIKLPEGMEFRHLVGAGFLGGLGFTMALFIGGLAFDNPILHEASKMGILLGSLVAGILGYVVLRTAPIPPPGLRMKPAS